MNIPGLRSPHETTGGIVYFARMLDKARLHAEGKLPPDYVENLGTAFDGRCCSFLHVQYAALVDRILAGGSDDEILQWCLNTGSKPTDEQIEIWNDFMSKRGWNDAVSDRLQFRLKEADMVHRTDIQTMFDYIDLDEGRDPARKN